MGAAAGAAHQNFLTIDSGQPDGKPWADLSRWENCGQLCPRFSLPSNRNARDEEETNGAVCDVDAAVKILQRLPLLWKMLFPLAIAGICLLAYLGSSTIVLKHNNSRLVNVRDVQFPVLEITTDNVKALDNIIEQLNHAAGSGERDPLDAAEVIAAKVRANYTRLRGIDAAQVEQFQRLAAEFDSYYAVARAIAKQMMEQSGVPDPQSLQAMSAKLDAYRKDLFSFRDGANNRFTDTIDRATSDADGAVSTGVIIGLLSLCLTLGFGTVIARALLRQLQQALKVAQTVAAGDLTSRIEVTSHDETGQLLQALQDMNDSLVRSVDEHTRLEALLQHQASHDTLTGLPNRALLQDRLKQAIASATRSPSPIWIIFVDLDRFKLVNDSLGHKAGDAMLKQVATRLQSAVRESDTVARLGGDEFVLILPERVDGSGSLSAAVVQRILDALARPIIVEGHEFVTTCSMGIAVYPDDGADGETLMTRADIAMYSAKEAGRNNFRFYAPAMDERLLERLRLEGELRHALERNEFELHYQPQVDLRTGRIVGMESLLRWNHPELGMIPPGKFISLAEETGLIVPIGAWVIRTACAQTQAWQRAGLGRLRVAVNLSARQFAQKNLAGSIMNILDETGLAAEDLEIELTESLVMTDVERAIGVLRDLKEIGVQLSIDDFGTGYSSLSYLKRFPIHVLKIDQSFVRDIAAGADDAAIVALIISLAHSLKLNVIAEGVETPEQLAYLNQHDCDEMQGYLFSKPLPAAAFEKLLRNGNCLSAEPGRAAA
jgi:diguanylate cyclase (GGDEF)-like protein